MLSAVDLLDRPSPLTLSVVPYTRELWLKAEPDWSALAQGNDASAFVSAPWMAAWLDVYGERLRSELLVWRDSRGATAGICVLTTRTEWRGPFRVRRAFINATGEHQLCSEHNRVLCLRQHEDAVHADLVRHVHEHADALILSGFASDAADAIRRHWPGDGPTEGHHSEDYFVELGALRERGIDYLGSLSANTRQQIRRSIRWFEERFGPRRLEVASGASEALEQFGTLRRLHEARWAGSGGATGFLSPDSVRFHEALVRGHAGETSDATREFSVDLLQLRFGEVVVGVVYNLVHRHRVSFFQSGLLYLDDNRAKPGLVTHALAIQHYLDAGAAEYDMLGDPNGPVRYKASLASGRRLLGWMELSKNTPKMEMLFRLKRLRRTTA